MQTIKWTICGVTSPGVLGGLKGFCRVSNPFSDHYIILSAFISVKKNIESYEDLFYYNLLNIWPSDLELFLDSRDQVIFYHRLLYF